MPSDSENQLKGFMKYAQHGEVVWLNSGYKEAEMGPQSPGQNTRLGLCPNQES